MTTAGPFMDDTLLRELVRTAGRIAIAALVGLWARARGRSFGRWYLLAYLCTFVVAIPALVFQPRVGRAGDDGKVAPGPMEAPLAAGVTVLTIALALLLRTYVVETRTIASNSMAPALLLGDKVLVQKWDLAHAPIQRGDLVLFQETLENGKHRTYLRRVAGLPGNTTPQGEAVSTSSLFLTPDNPEAGLGTEVLQGVIVERKSLTGKVLARFWPARRIGSI